MVKLLREYRFFTTLAILTLIPIISLNSSSKTPIEYNIIEKAAVFVAAPLQSAITFTIDKFAFFFQNYIFLQNVNQQYSEMVEENRKLRNVIHNMKEIEVENTRLRALLQFQNSIEEKKVTAQVIAKDVSTEFRSIRINKGSADGIARGMSVVTHEGIVGRILRTTAHYSDIITTLDNLSSIDAIVQRSRARGVIEGLTDSTCILKYALRTEDIELGDVIVSSGLDGVHPKGLMLGTVNKIDKKTYGITQEVIVRPNVDFSKLEEVLVLLKQDRAPVEELENSATTTNASAASDGKK